MKRLILFFCAHALLSACPECYSDYSPAAYLQSNVINIYIDSSVPSAGVAAVSAAISKWTAATDYDGNHIAYTLSVVTDRSQANEVVTMDTNNLVRSGTAGTSQLGSSSPATTYLRPELFNPSNGVSPDQLAGTIAHEFGHVMGAADDGPQSSSCGTETIMGGATNWRSDVTTVAAGDVASVNSNQSSYEAGAGQSFDCTTTWSYDSGYGTGGQDNYCSDVCDPLCDDYDPSACPDGCDDPCDSDCYNYDPSLCDGGCTGSTGTACSGTACSGTACSGYGCSGYGCDGWGCDGWGCDGKTDSTFAEPKLPFPVKPFAPLVTSLLLLPAALRVRIRERQR